MREEGTCFVCVGRKKRERERGKGIIQKNSFNIRSVWKGNDSIFFLGKTNNTTQGRTIRKTPSAIKRG
jgi:hypothetical protein